jgi:hypothetical protein
VIFVAVLAVLLWLLAMLLIGVATAYEDPCPEPSGPDRGPSDDAVSPTAGVVVRSVAEGTRMPREHGSPT